MSIRRMMAGSVLAAGLLLLFGAMAPAQAHPGDVDGDLHVDLQDLAALLGCYGCCDPDPCHDDCAAADFDDSGCIDMADLDTLLVNYGWSGVVIETVTVGNPGNADDTHGDGYGGVDYAYNIGKYEVTAGQYTAFLNAVAGMDTYGLYNTNMWSSDRGCKIQRSRSSGRFAYSVAPDWADRPVNYVSWGDAARFANWLHNGQPTGGQNLSTTEDGSYFLWGATSDWELELIWRASDATWVIPSEDEWYKAAYHKNDGVTGNYWDYPMGSSAVPDNGNPGGDTGNSANFYDDDYTIGSPYWRTEVGYFGLSASPYGTFDQGGNVWEWNEATFWSGFYRGLRGGWFTSAVDSLLAAYRSIYHPSFEADYIGFRVSEVP